MPRRSRRKALLLRTTRPPHSPPNTAQTGSFGGKDLKRWGAKRQYAQDAGSQLWRLFSGGFRRWVLGWTKNGLVEGRGEVHERRDSVQDGYLALGPTYI